MKDTEIIAAVSLINDEIFEATNETHTPLIASFDGGYGYVDFFSQNIWREDEDERETDEESGEPIESLPDYLRRECKRLIGELHAYVETP